MLRLLRKKPEEQPPEPGPLALADIENALLRELEAGERGPVNAVALAIQQAMHHRASDLHFEPWADCLALRFRIDGVLHDVARLPKTHQPKIIARIKVLAKLIVYQKDKPQEGRIDGHESWGGQAMRVSTFPTVYGEKTVIRVLDATYNLIPLDGLGFREELTSSLRDLVFRPQGAILLTGPSSSGKTTTIYALLRELLEARRPKPHVVTIEDPVEYQLGHIAQTQVNPHAGFTFAAALRSILRQDPDVIMVGEIRDVETARAVIQAGLTGHLVISTIHSGTAAGVFTRLLDMEIEPFLVASSVTGALAQRLVRLNCRACAEPYEPDPALAARYGLRLDTARFLRGKGCDQCQGIGFQGRTAIGELLVANEEIADCILARSRTRVIHEAALRNQLSTLIEDGLARVKDGVTTLEELSLVLPPTAERGEG